MQPDFLGAAGSVFSRDASYPGLGGPMVMSKESGWYGGLYAGRMFGLHELQVIGGAVAVLSPNSEFGMGYARSFYDRRGVERFGVSSALKGKRLIGAVQLNVIHVKWMQENPGNYNVSGCIAFAVRCSQDLLIGCAVKAPEAYLVNVDPVITATAGLATEAVWTPEENVRIALQLKHNEQIGLSWGAEFRFETRSGWQMVAGCGSSQSLYHLRLILPLGKMNLGIAFGYHTLLGVSPSADWSGQFVNPMHRK